MIVEHDIKIYRLARRAVSHMRNECQDNKLPGSVPSLLLYSSAERAHRLDLKTRAGTSPPRGNFLQA